jgi:hypothetical protein
MVNLPTIRFQKQVSTALFPTVFLYIFSTLFNHILYISELVSQEITMCVVGTFMMGAVVTGGVAMGVMLVEGLGVDPGGWESWWKRRTT